MTKDQSEYESTFEEGRRLKIWKNMGECADALDMDRGTFSKYFHLGEGACKGERGKNFYAKKLTKLKRIVSSRKGGNSPEATTVAIAEAAKDWEIPLLIGLKGMLTSLITEAVGLRMPEATPPPQAAQKAVPAVDSTWVDDVIAGRKELRGDSPANGVRFLLTADTFVTLVTQFTSNEIQDTVEFVRTVLTPAVGEVRRRLVRSAQLDDNKHRDAIIGTLAREFDELFLALEHAKEVIPTKTFALYEDRRQRMSALNEKPQSKKS